MTTSAPATASPDTTSPAAPEPANRHHSLDSLMIQRATPAHVPYLQRLKEQVMQKRYRPAADEEGCDKWREVYCTESYFEDIIANPNEMLLCIGTLREPVGMVALRRDGNHLEIDDLLVLTPRRGDGTRMLLSALRYAEVWRIKDVHIDVYPNNDNVGPFLAEHGFTLAGESQNDLGRPMHRYERTI